MRNLLTSSSIVMAVLSILLFYLACIASWNYSKNNRFELLLKNTYKNILWRESSNPTPIYWISWSVAIRLGVVLLVLLPLNVLTRNITWDLISVFVVDHLFSALSIMVINDLTTQYIQHTRKAIDASKMLI